MYAPLLLVVSIDAGRDYRAPVQNRCSKGALRPRSVSSPYPRLVLTPRFRLLFLLLLFRDMRTASEVWLPRCNTDAASGPPGASASVHAQRQRGSKGRKQKWCGVHGTVEQQVGNGVR